MSLMKRDTPVYYSGEKGVIHSVYFTPGVSVDQGAPLIGVCPAEKLPLIKKIITRVKADWDKQELVFLVLADTTFLHDSP